MERSDSSDSATDDRGGGVSRRNVLRSTVLTGIGGAAAADLAGADRDSATDRDDAPFADETVLREDYWIETDTDTDGSGDPDRIHVEIARPESTTGDTQLPVIMEASPYFGEFADTWRGPYDMQTELYRPDGEATADATEPSGSGLFQTEEDLAEFTGVDDPNAIGPSAYEEIFLQEGYVFAYAAAPGTEQSTGCTTTGDDREIAAFQAVIDWFNGRATAYDSKVGGTEQTADWTDGNTGMIGASYNGTIPNALAATGIDGLKTIVPIVAISSWYNYYRFNGAVIAPGSRDRGSTGVDTDYMASVVLTRENPSVCEPVLDELTNNQDRLTGNYSDFWAERNYVPDADNVEASVLIAHGLDDNNVKMRHGTQWLDALKEYDVPYKVWFHQDAHQDPLNLHENAWVDLLSDWWAHWLKDEDTGVMDRPTATVQRRGEGDEPKNWPLETYGDWPDPSAEHVPVSLTPGGSERGGITTDSAEAADESFVDDSSTPPLSLFGAESSPNRLLYTSEPLETDLRLSGRPSVELSVSVDDEVGLLSAAVVDFDPDGNAYDVNRGWLNLQNRNGRDEVAPITPGEVYDVEFSIQGIDHVFEAGHRLGIAIYSSDYNYTKRPPSEPEFTVSLGESSVAMPAVGGQEALATALGDGPLDCGSYIDEITENGEITTPALRAAVNDWRDGTIETDCLMTILDQWRSA